MSVEVCCRGECERECACVCVVEGGGWVGVSRMRRRKSNSMAIFIFILNLTQTYNKISHHHTKTICLGKTFWTIRKQLRSINFLTVTEASCIIFLYQRSGYRLEQSGRSLPEIRL